MTTALADAVSVTKTFGSHLAVDKASLRVEPGELVGLIGANGAGKTTLIRVLLGLVAPTRGDVSLFGEPPSRRTRGRIGYVPQGLGLYRDLTVEQNAAFVAGAFHARAARDAIPEVLRGSKDELVGRIGLGHQRQLAFACALAHGPELLVLDEPTSGVSPLARARLWDKIHEQADQGIGVLVTTHYLQEAQQCDRLVVMAVGRVVASGTIDEVIAGRQAIEVHARSWTDAYNALRAAGTAVTLAGTHVRVADATVRNVERILADAHVDADLKRVSGTLEEAMLVIARTTDASET